MPLNIKHLIREARRADVPAIARLVDEFAAHMRDLGDTTEQRLSAAVLERDGFGPDPAFRGLVAEVRCEVVGYLLHFPGYDTDLAVRLLFVGDLYVARAARGRGIGAALMDEARLIARMNGAKQLAWTVDRRNAMALRFYERLGATYADIHVMYVDA